MTRMSTLKNPFFILLLLPLFSCEREVEEGPELHKDYFPVSTGHRVTYEVDSIFHDSAVETHDTSHYFIREEIESSFIDNEGRTAYRLERYRKDSADDDWSIADVWTSYRNEERAEKVEENQRFIKMTFPVQDGKDWNGNAFNDLNDSEYRYRNVHQSRTVEGKVLDSTVSVLQEDEENLIEKRFSEEIYSKGIGMVEKTKIGLETYTSGEIRRGSELYMRMTDHQKP